MYKWITDNHAAKTIKVKYSKVRTLHFGFCIRCCCQCRVQYANNTTVPFYYYVVHTSLFLLRVYNLTVCGSTGAKCMWKLVVVLYCINVNNLLTTVRVRQVLSTSCVYILMPNGLFVLYSSEQSRHFRIRGGTPSRWTFWEVLCRSDAFLCSIFTSFSPSPWIHTSLFLLLVYNLTLCCSIGAKCMWKLVIVLFCIDVNNFCTTVMVRQVLSTPCVYILMPNGLFVLYSSGD